MTSRPEAARGGRPGGTATAPPKRLALLVGLAVVVLAADVVSKSIIVASLQDGQRVPLVGDVVALQLVRNSGAAFSLATGMTWVLTLVALAVVIGIARFARRLRSPGWAVALGLVLGGALGNLVDRFFRAPGPLRGHVVDFISVGWWPVFNLADSSICVGGALLVLLALLGYEIDGTTRGESSAPVADAPVEETSDPDAPDPDDRGHRSAIRWPARKWDKPGEASPQHGANGANGVAGTTGSEPVDEDDLLDEDDRLPGRTRHAANKWESG